MLFAFTQFPDQWSVLRDNRGLLKRTFEESLRWDSTAQAFFRTTTGDATIDDTTIPRRSKLLLFLGRANRAPRLWNDPDRFDVMRVASGHVVFGFGIRQRVSPMMARQEAEMVLEVLLTRVSAIRLAGPAKRRLNTTLHALSSLLVDVVPASAGEA